MSLQPILHSAEIPGIFSTGVLNDGSLAPGDSPDLHYSLLMTPGGGGGTALVTSQIPGPWLAQGPESKWLSPSAVSADLPAGEYTYQTSFDLTGLDPGTASITGRFSSDDSVRVFLNGVLVAEQSNGYWAWNALTITNGFVPGINVLNFRVYNSIGPTGLRIDQIQGTASSAAPKITHQPTSQLAIWGGSVSFVVVAEGVGTLAYQWNKDQTPIPGATEPSLVLTNLQMTAAGTYTVVITNLYGSVTSAPAILTINPSGTAIALYAGVTVQGIAGQTYGIQSTTDLNNTNTWIGRTNLTLTTPVYLWYDWLPASNPQRFYRVLPGPIPIP